MSVERSGTALPPVDDVAGERRSKQRFVARRRGEPCFWLVLDGQRIALNDLSAEGFSLAMSTSVSRRDPMRRRRAVIFSASRGMAHSVCVTG